MNLPLLDHQVGDIEWIGRVKRGLLANEPGLGKSRSAIQAFDGGKNLVIAPGLVIEGGTWSDELAKWSSDPENPDMWTVVPYSYLNAREKTGKNASATRPVDKLRPEFDQTYDNIIIDEAHYIKGRNNHWTWATETLTKRAGDVLEMTGTPMPNWAHELYMLLRVLYPNECAPGKRFGSYWRWVGEWFKVEPSRHNPRARVIGGLLQCVPSCERLYTPYNPCPHYDRFVEENLGDKIRLMTRDECLDLPPATEQVVQTPMDDVQKRMYRELKKDFATDYDGEEVLAWSQGSLNVLLDRITTSAWCVNPVGPAKGGKFERLRFDLGNRARPTLVLAHYRTSVDGCADIARQLGMSAEVVHGGISKSARSDTIARFKAGKLDVLVGSLETLAEGLTLTAADEAIFVETSYKPSRNTQARYRIWRVGQTRPVTIRDYVTPATVDFKKRKLLAEKTDQQMKVLTAAQFKEIL